MPEKPSERQVKIVQGMLKELDGKINFAKSLPGPQRAEHVIARENIRRYEEKIDLVLVLFDCKTLKELRALVFTSEEDILEAISGCRTPADLKQKVLSGQISLR